MRLIFILFITIVSNTLSAEDKKVKDFVDTNKLEKILGKDWKRLRGMIIENEKEVDKLTGTEKELGKLLMGMMKRHGVIACGNFSYSRTTHPINTVNIRIFKFSTQELADKFRKLKYENKKAQPLYKKTKNQSTITYDSLQMKKRIIFQGNIWITCGHIQKDDQHLKILKECIKITSPNKEKENK